MHTPLPDATRASRMLTVAARRTVTRTRRIRRTAGAMCTLAFTMVLTLPLLSSSPAWIQVMAAGVAYVPVLIALPRVSMSRWSVIPMLVIPLLNVVTVYRVGYRASLLPARDWPPLPSERDRIHDLSQHVYIVT